MVGETKSMEFNIHTGITFPCEMQEEQHEINLKEGLSVEELSREYLDEGPELQEGNRLYKYIEREDPWKKEYVVETIELLMKVEKVEGSVCVLSMKKRYGLVGRKRTSFNTFNFIWNKIPNTVKKVIDDFAGSEFWFFFKNQPKLIHTKPYYTLEQYRADKK